MREEGPNRKKKRGILKYLSVEISSEKSEIIQRHRTCVSVTLGQKLGYESCYHQILRGIFKLILFQQRVLLPNV